MIQKVVQLVQRRSIQRFSSVFVAHRNRDDNSDSVPFDFTDENYKKIEGILSKFPSNEKSGTIPLLMLAQKQNNNFLSLSAMKKIAKILEIPEMDVFETASFYSMFNRERVGKFHLQVCGTTPCQLCGSKDIIKAIEQQLNIKNGETSADGLFTLQEVECLGACANAPMMQVNNEWVYEDLTPENTLKLLEDLKNGTDKKDLRMAERMLKVHKVELLYKTLQINRILNMIEILRQPKGMVGSKEKERLEAEKEASSIASQK